MRKIKMIRFAIWSFMWSHDRRSASLLTRMLMTSSRVNRAHVIKLKILFFWRNFFKCFKIVKFQQTSNFASSFDSSVTSSLRLKKSKKDEWKLRRLEEWLSENQMKLMTSYRWRGEHTEKNTSYSVDDVITSSP